MNGWHPPSRRQLRARRIERLAEAGLLVDAARSSLAESRRDHARGSAERRQAQRRLLDVMKRLSYHAREFRREERESIHALRAAQP